MESKEPIDDKLDNRKLDILLDEIDREDLRILENHFRRKHYVEAIEIFKVMAIAKAKMLRFIEECPIMATRVSDIEQIAEALKKEGGNEQAD